MKGHLKNQMRGDCKNLIEKMDKLRRQLDQADQEEDDPIPAHDDGK